MAATNPLRGRRYCAVRLRNRRGEEVRDCGGVALPRSASCNAHLFQQARGVALDLGEQEHPPVTLPLPRLERELSLEELLGLGIYVAERLDGVV